MSKKAIRILFFTLISIIGFFTKNSDLYAAFDYECHYEYECDVGCGSSPETLEILCYKDGGTIECIKNGNYTFIINGHDVTYKDTLNEHVTKYNTCPNEFPISVYKGNNCSTSQIYFNTGTEKATLNSFSSQVNKMNANETVCGQYDNSVWAFTITSTKLSDGTFKYSGSYWGIAGYNNSNSKEIPEQTINEILSQEGTIINKKTGCPKELNNINVDFDGAFVDEHAGDAKKVEKTKEDNSTEWEKIKPANAFGLALDGDLTCDDQFGTALKYLKLTFKGIKIAAALLLTLLTVKDFAMSVVDPTGRDAKNPSYDMSIKNFKKRAIYCAILFLLPSLITFVLKVIGLTQGVCGIK